MRWTRLRAAITGHRGGPAPERAASAGVIASRPDLDESLIEGIHDAVLVTDADLRIVRFNPAMERLARVPTAEVLGRSLAGAVALLDALGLPRLLGDAIATGAGTTREVPHPAAAGGAGGWMEVRCAALRDAAGKVSGAAAFLGDVTERRRHGLFVRALQLIGRALSSSLDLNEVLDMIVDKAREVMGADSALVVSGDGNGPFRMMRAAGRLSAEYCATGTIPVSGGPTSRAVLEARTITTSNILKDPRLWLSAERRRDVEREGFKAVAATPLVSKGHVHGALVVHYWWERSFTDEDTTALALLGEQAAIGLEHARLYSEARRQADRMRELAEVERVVIASLDLDDVLQRIAEATARLVGAPVVQVWTAEPGARVLRRRASTIEPGLASIESPITLAFGQGVSGTAAEQKAPIFVPDVRSDARVVTPAWEHELGLSTVLAVPLLAGDSLLGVLTVRARAGALATEEDRALVGALAARAAIAIQNARLYAHAVRRAARLQDLAAVSQSITASLDTGDVMQRIANAAAAMRAGAMAAVHVFDPAASVLRFAAGSRDDFKELPSEMPASAGLPGLVFERRLPVLIAEPLHDPRTLRPDWWEGRSSSSYYGVPIVVGETFMGVIDYILPEGLPDREEQEALQLLAAQAGIAMRNASLYQAERVQTERNRALVTINQRISSALDLEALLRTIAESAANLAGVSFASFWLADRERRTLTIKGVSAPGVVNELLRPVVTYDDGAVGWVARSRTPLAIDDVPTDPRIMFLDWWADRGFVSFAGYPVVAGDQLLAVLVLSHAQPFRPTDETREVIEMFIAQAAVAIQNARLYREAHGRREVAETLARLARELTASLEPVETAGLIARGMLELAGGRFAVVFRHDAEDGRLHAISSSGHEAARFDGLVLEPGEGAVGRAVADRCLVASPNVLTDERFTFSPGLRERAAHESSRAVVAVPLLVRDRVVGAIAVGDEEGHELSEAQRQAVQALADQAALALENARLYASVRDSFARLRDTQAQLVQAAKMSALGQLVSGVAHELNNPLSVIIGYGQLLMTRQVPPAFRRPLELIVSQADRMAKIVRNLLYFARQRPPERAAVDLHEIIEQTLALRANQLTLAGITVERDFAADLPQISGDSQQLQQVMLNLLLNAEQAIVAAKPQGRIVFRTSISKGTRPVCVDIVDDGPGIPPEVLSRVFEPFFTTKEVGVGTGLGLSVSYGIVEEHGGKLAVESQPGRTVFTLEFPLAGAYGEGAARPPLPLFRGDGRRALVVEDETSVVDLVVTLLEEAGWAVDIAGGGHEGLDRLRSTAYDLVVSDIRMPEGGGEQLYHAAGILDPALARRFLFITGDTANPDAWRFLNESGVRVVEKPFQPDVFLDAVRRVVTAGQ